MKWSIIFLLILGIFAAGAATMLTSSLRISDSLAQPDEEPPETPIILAKEDLTGSTVITEDMLTSRVLTAGEHPEKFYSHPAEIVGRRLVKPMIAGEAFRPASFLSATPGADMAFQLEPGMRAVSIQIRSSSAMAEMLYPGCTVDVLVSFSVRSGGNVNGEALSTTLLEGVRVLAIENLTLYRAHPQDEDADADPNEDINALRTRANQGNLSVMLLVNPPQAEALQLASDYGTIALALRNPFDEDPVDSEATLLSQGRLAQMAELLETSVQGGKLKDSNVTRNTRAQNANMNIDALADALRDRLREDMAAAPAPTPQPVATPRPTPRPRPMWSVDIIRGVEVETKQYPAS